MTWDIAGFGTLDGRHPEELVSALNDVEGICARSIEEFSGRVLENTFAGLAFWLQSPPETS